MASVADYWHTTAPYGIIVQIGGHVFRSSPDNPSFLVELVNNHYSGGDNYLLRSYTNLPTEGASIDHISWQLDDPTETRGPSLAFSVLRSQFVAGFVKAA